MAIDVQIERVRFSGGDEVVPPTGGVLLIVGPNNVGKSMALRDLVGLMTNVPQGGWQPRVVTGLDVTKTGAVDEFEAWLNEHMRRREPSAANAQVTFAGPGIGRVGWPELRSAWEAGPPLGRAASLFVQYLAPGERLNLLGSVGLWDAMQEDPQQPLQLMYDTPALEDELGEAAREAFGVELFVNRYAGTNIHLQVGPRPKRVPPPVPREFMEELRGFPHVHEQGDGLRSFMGILLTLIAGVQRILVIDEPEAFLHPPQAKLLGRKLAEVAPAGRQVVAATHSADVVVGALDAPDSKVTIIRLTRADDANAVSVLPHDQLRELWNDPLLRYSNVLDGLFHRSVVITEADGDSMFFAAAFDHWLLERGLPSPEVLFTHAAGKSRMFKVAAALRALGVPVRVIADIDILNDTAELRRLLEALGADAQPILNLQAMVHSDVSSGAPNPRKEFVADRMAEVLSDCPPGEPLPDSAVKDLRALLRATRGWALLKDAGVEVLKGDTLVRCREAIELCRQAGLLILDGELESFDKTIPLHGPDWVAEALARDSHKQERAQSFAATVAESLGIG